MGLSEKISSLILIVFGLFVSGYSYRYLKVGAAISPDAGFIPFYIGIALVILGTVWLVKVFRAGTVSGASNGRGVDEDAAGLLGRGILRRFLPGILLVILYAWLFEKAGYILSTVLFMVGWQKLVERERWLKTALITIICAGAMYVLFARLLKIALPAGSWLS